MKDDYRERLHAHITSSEYRATVRRSILLAVIAWLACSFVVVRFAIKNPEGPANFPHGGTTGYLVASIVYWGVFCALFNFALVVLARYVTPLFRRRGAPPLDP